MHRSFAFASTSAACIAAVFLLSASGLSAQVFDPASVMSPECRNGTLKCGFLPAAPDEMRSLPMVDSAFYRSRGLPSRVDLSDSMPPVGFQGEQGSCLGWALAYTIRSYQERKVNNWQYDPPTLGGRGERVFSPAFIYNQINGGRDQGSDPLSALRLIVQRGVASWKTMPYNLNDFRSQPGPEALAEAMRFRARGFRRVSTQDLDSIRTELASGHPVMLGVLLHENFYQVDKNNPVYDQLRGRFLGGHAVVIVGYDDQRATAAGPGALKVQNSYGRAWGDNGYGYIAYRLLALAGTAAFVVEQPDGKTSVASTNQTVVYFAPREVAASRGLYPNRVDLAWSAVSSAIAYEVQRSSGGQFDKIGYSVKAQFTDSSAKQGVVYRYRIVSIFRAGRSVPELSPVVEGFAAVPGMFAALPRVVGVVAEKIISVFTPGVPPVTVQQQGQTIRWAAAPGAESYDVSRYEPALKSFRVIAAVREPVFTDARMEGATYSVRARSRLGVGAWSRIAQSQRPAAQDLRATKDLADRVEIRWAGVPGARSYRVQVRDADTGAVQRTEVSSRPEFTDTRAPVGKWMAYNVISVFDDAETISDAVYGQISTNRARSMMPAPGELRWTTVPSGAAQLEWTSVPGAERYFVFRRRERDADFALYAETTQPRFQDTQAPAGELLYYTVRAESSQGGESMDSNSIAVAMPRAPESPSAGDIADGRRASERAFREEMAPSAPAKALNQGPFSGQWIAQYWDGSAPVDVRIRLDVSGSGAAALVEWPGRAPYRSAGAHLADSQTLYIPGIEARLSGNLLLVEFTDYGPAPAPMTIAFRRP